MTLWALRMFQYCTGNWLEHFTQMISSHGKFLSGSIDSGLGSWTAQHCFLVIVDNGIYKTNANWRGVARLPWMADAPDSYNPKDKKFEERRGFSTTLEKLSVHQSSKFLTAQVR
ncbi:hypothetical protein V6N11_049024 [Hibiscus sabdariffa]|uniref:Uncharacterized protein n=1 Tax=Hibiscus sabdariffa TaxID=183260 RepID=A0ABR2PX09_9ROSI